MRTTELIKEIEKLPVQKRIFVIERTLQSIRRNEENSQMKKAADLLYHDYTNDSELTAFSRADPPSMDAVDRLSPIKNTPISEGALG